MVTFDFYAGQCLLTLCSSVCRQQDPLLGCEVSFALASLTSSDSDNVGTFLPSHALSAILVVEGGQICIGQSLGLPKRLKNTIIL